MPAKTAAKDSGSSAPLAPEAPAPAEMWGSELPRCERCKIGLLYPIALDPDATHEVQPASREGDPTSHTHFVASGGAVVMRCFHCGRSSSHAFSPGSD